MTFQEARRRKEVHLDNADLTDILISPFATEEEREEAVDKAVEKHGGQMLDMNVGSGRLRTLTLDIWEVRA